MEDRRNYGTSDHPATRAGVDAQPCVKITEEEQGGLHWTEAFAGRELMEIQFARVYHGEFGHGTPGHLHLILISQLSKLVDQLSERGAHREGQDQASG